MFVTLAIVCICFFILSFSLLFRKKLAKFFSAIFYFFKNLFRKKQIKNEKRVIASKNQVVPKMIGDKNLTRIDAPVQTFVKKSDITSFNNESVEKIQDNLDDKTLDRRYGLSFKEIERREKMDRERSELDEEIKKISKSMELEEKMSTGKTGLLSKKNSLPSFITNRTNEEEKAILSKRKFSDFDTFVEKDKTAVVEIDKEEIDLSKLPANIKKLLISGILDRKDF